MKNVQMRAMPVKVMAILIFARGVFGFSIVGKKIFESGWAGYVMTLGAVSRLSGEISAIFALLSLLVMLVTGLFIFRGDRWARDIFLGFSALYAGYCFFNFGLAFGLSELLNCLLFSFFLLRASARPYFAAARA